MFFGGFVVHLHVGCTMHNEEYHSVFIGLSKFKFGNKTQMFFPSKTLGLGHKRGASMAHVLATSYVAYVTFDAELALTRQSTLLHWLFYPFF
jgi:hypothetical protein